MKKIIIVTLITCAFTCCVSNETANSDSVKQSEIYQSYNITYDAGDMELSATAFFRFGGSTGTTLNLVKPSSISFNGTEMALGKNIFSGTFYEINQQIKSPELYTFVFIDTEKKSYINTVTINSLEISEYTEKIKKTEGFKVSWTGAPVKQNEKMYISLEGKDFNNCSSSTDVIGANSISISAEQLKDIKPGDANIILKREKSSSLKEATHLGGSITITYVAKKVSVKVE